MQASTAATRQTPEREWGPLGHAGDTGRSPGRRRRWVGRLICWLLVLPVVLPVGFALVFRSRWRPLLNLVRSFNKRILNPAMLIFAGRPHWYAAVVRHVGRRSGHLHATPVVAEPTADGFIIPLPYGVDVDWLKNVLAAGRAVIRRNAVEYTVVQPAVIDQASALAVLPLPRQLAFRLYGVRHFLKVTKVSAASDDASPDAGHW